MTLIFGPAWLLGRCGSPSLYTFALAITGRTRKLLWARSGNRCAICRCVLIVAATESDAEAVVGDECHIEARNAGGPRAGVDAEQTVDDYDNLILLCKIDHKRIDDQKNYFTVERLQAIKMAHEAWVHTSLSAQAPTSFQYRIRKGPDEQRFRLTLLSSARELLSLVSSSYGYDFDHDELESENEVDLVADFLQELHDIGDTYDEIESGERVRISFQLGNAVRELAERGFLVYGGKLQRVLEIGNDRSPWPISMIRVMRASNPAIQRDEGDE